MPHMDIFNNDAFSVVSLTDAINKLKFVPGRLGQLGIFQETSVATTLISIEEKNNVLELIPPTPRGGPGTTLDKAKRAMRAMAVPHFEINDAVYADEVQNLRPFGEETGLDSVQRMVSDRLAVASQSIEATLELSRIGAVKGVVVYADGSQLNLFNEFGVSQITEVDFDLDNANPAGGALRKKCGDVIRLMIDELGAVPVTGVSAICGDAFYNDLIAHKEVRETYLNQIQAAELREGYIQGGMSYGSFNFGGITWENYRGKVGSTDYIHTDKCHLYPVVPGLFRTVFAPADYNETVNTLGLRTYVKQYEMQNGKGIHLDTQSNALSYCTRPRALIQGKRT